MHLYADQFSQEHDFPPVEAPTKILIIASTGRCGSHMLGHALFETKKFGFPLEYLNPANLAQWKRLLEINNTQQVIREIQKRRTSPNGVFAIKVHYPHIKALGGFDNFIKCFPNAYYVLLSRKNVLKQAVSLSLASQTGVWISGQKPTNDNPIYNFEHIDNCLRETILNNASWRYSLAATGRSYIEMDFDHVRSNLAHSINAIADFIDIALSEKDIPATQVTKRQSNSLNADWEAKFLEDVDKSSELCGAQSDSLIHKVKKKLTGLTSK